MSRKRHVRRRKKKNVSIKNTLMLKTLVALSLTLYLFVSFNKISDFIISKRLEEKIASAKHLSNIKTTPLPSPLPTATPTPTAVPLVGYCLNVPVLMYHHIQPQKEAREKEQEALSIDSETFDQQMNYLASSGYSTVFADQLVNALLNHSTLPQKSIVITVDDGYEDFYIYAYPVLKKYNLVANLAVITGLVGESDYVSWSQLEEMSKSGSVYMTNHTWSHHSLIQGTSGKITFEVETAKQQLQDHTGKNIDTFIYPFGEVNADAIEILRNEEVKGAFSQIPGYVQCDSFIMSLHRTRIGNFPLSHYSL